MTPSSACIELIKNYEGCSLEAYPDPGTGGEPITIGYGHTGGITLGTVWTQEQADEALADDIDRFAEGVTDLLTVPVTQGEFDALVSFAYNVGLHNLKDSTLLKKVNSGDMLAASLQFYLWCHAAGQVLPGLVARRAAERSLFKSETEVT